jgi:hypothetical protein
MITIASDRRWVVAIIATVALIGCSHKTASSQISSGLAPFSTSRNQALGLVAHTKRTLGAADANTFAVAYTDLQEKANAYAGFMIEAVTTSSFDPARNAKYSSDLSKAIADFNKSYDSMEGAHQDVVGGKWVAPFAQSLQNRWDQFSGIITGMSPQTKADLIAELKRDTVWPNYEDIATEPVATAH